MISEIDFNEIYDKYYQFVLLISYSFFHNKTDSEDIVQDVFMKYLKSEPKFANEIAQKSWFYKVTYHTCINEVRKKGKYISLKQELSTEEIAIPQEDNNVIFNHISNLSNKYKAVIILYYYRNSSVSEIAEILKISESAVKKRLERARDKIKIAMEG